MDRRNLPGDQVAVLMTREQLAFMVKNCESNETYAMNQLMALSNLLPEDLTDSVKESFLKLDALKNQFRDLRRQLEGQLND